MEEKSPLSDRPAIVRVPAMHPNEIMIAAFERQLHKSPQQIILPGSEAKTIAAQHNLQIDWLSTYYLRLHSWSKLIIYFAEALCRIDSMDEDAKASFRKVDYTKMALNPGRGQIAPNGAAAIEFSYGFPVGLHTVLGFLPIAGHGIIQGDFKKITLSNLIQNFLHRYAIKEIDPSTYLVVCNPLESNCVDVVERTDADQIPFEHAVTLWGAIKPEERAEYC